MKAEYLDMIYEKELEKINRMNIAIKKLTKRKNNYIKDLCHKYLVTKSEIKYDCKKV